MQKSLVLIGNTCMHAVAGSDPGESCSADAAELAQLLQQEKALNESRTNPRMTTGGKTHLPTKVGAQTMALGKGRSQWEMPADIRQSCLLCSRVRSSTVRAHPAHRGTRAAPALCLCPLGPAELTALTQIPWASEVMHGSIFCINTRVIWYNDGTWVPHMKISVISLNP